jgi:hypothetical protein
MAPNDAYAAHQLSDWIRATSATIQEARLSRGGTRGQGPNKRPRDCPLYLAFSLRSKENENSVQLVWKTHNSSHNPRLSLVE